MDESMQALLDHLKLTNFADLKGSSAELHLEIPERILNDLLALAMKTQEKAHPWLGLVTSAEVKGSVRIDVKVSV